VKTFIYITLCFIIAAQYSFSAEVSDPIPDEPIVKQRDFTGMIIPIKVIIHPSDEHLNKAYNVFYGVQYEPLIWGWYGIRKGVCEIHVIELKSVNNDPRMQAWGHELAHCLYGLYHK